MALHLVLHSYSLRFHFLHKPGFDVFAFIDRAVADGFTGVNINANGANYRHLSGMGPDHVAAVRRRLDRHALLRDLETSGTDPAHLQTLLAVAQALGARALRTYTRHKGSPRDTVAATTRDLIAAAPLAAAAGVRILLENHEDFTGGECAEILAAVDSSWVGALYDYGNSMMVMEEPLAARAAQGARVGAGPRPGHRVGGPPPSVWATTRRRRRRRRRHLRRRLPGHRRHRRRRPSDSYRRRRHHRPLPWSSSAAGSGAQLPGLSSACPASP